MAGESHPNLLPAWKTGVSPNPGGKPKAPTQIMRIVREAAGTHSLEAINTLYSVMVDSTQKAQARVVAACAILDRAIGKPKEFMEVTQKSPLEGMTSAELLALLEKVKSARASEVSVVIEQKADDRD